MVSSWRIREDVFSRDRPSSCEEGAGRPGICDAQGELNPQSEASQMLRNIECGYDMTLSHDNCCQKTRNPEVSGLGDDGVFICTGTFSAVNH